MIPEMPILWRSGVCSSYAWHWKHNNHYYHKKKVNCGRILTLGCMMVLYFWTRWRGHYFVTYIDMNTMIFYIYYHPPPFTSARPSPSTLTTTTCTRDARPSTFFSLSQQSPAYDNHSMIFSRQVFCRYFCWEFYKHETDLVFCLIFRPRNIQIHLFTCMLVHQEKLES